MDIYEYLEKDHKEVSDLFKQLNKTTLEPRKLAIIQFIILKITVHAKSEEQSFYTLLKSFNHSKDEAIHGKDEHQAIDDLMQAILKAIKTNNSWEMLAAELEEKVEHHVKEEESIFFRKAKEVLTPEQENHVKEEMHYLKSKLLAAQQSSQVAENK